MAARKRKTARTRRSGARRKARSRTRVQTRTVYRYRTRKAPARRRRRVRSNPAMPPYVKIGGAVLVGAAGATYLSQSEAVQQSPIGTVLPEVGIGVKLGVATIVGAMVLKKPLRLRASTVTLISAAGVGMFAPEVIARTSGLMAAPPPPTLTSNGVANLVGGSSRPLMIAGAPASSPSTPAPALAAVAPIGGYDRELG